MECPLCLRKAPTNLDMACHLIESHSYQLVGNRRLYVYERGGLACWCNSWVPGSRAQKKIEYGLHLEASGGIAACLLKAALGVTND